MGGELGVWGAKPPGLGDSVQGGSGGLPPGLGYGVQGGSWGWSPLFISARRTRWVRGLAPSLVG